MSIRKKIALSISLVILFNAVIIYFIIIPTVSDIKMISDAVYKERVDLEKKYQRGQLLNKTLENFERVKSEQVIFKKAFIAEENELTFVTALENIAGKHNLEQHLQLASAKISESKNLYLSRAITITLRGTYEDTLNYLHDLESMDVFVNLANISLSSVEKVQAVDAPMQISLSGKIFYLPISE